MASQPSLPPDEDVDLSDLPYYARTGELDLLSASLASLIAHPPADPSLPSPLSVRSLLALPSDDYSKMTPLHAAAANGHLHVVSWLLAALASDSVPATTTSTSPPSPPTATVTLPANLIDPTTSSDNTPLHWAALNGHKPVVDALCAAGADTEKKNAAGRTAVEEAEGADRWECAEALWAWTLKRERAAAGQSASADEGDAADGGEAADAEVDGSGSGDDEGDVVDVDEKQEAEKNAPSKDADVSLGKGKGKAPDAAPAREGTEDRPGR